MQCFKCHKNMSQGKSKYGFYYFCPNCGRKFETGGQQRYNSKKYNSRFDYENKGIVESSNPEAVKNIEQNTSTQK